MGRGGRLAGVALMVAVLGPLLVHGAGATEEDPVPAAFGVVLTARMGETVDWAGFGVAEGATAGYQSPPDQLEAPPPYGSSWLQAYFEGGGHRLNRSFVGPEPFITWPLVVDASGGGGAVVLSWDATDLAAVSSDFRVELVDGSIVIDMRAAPSYSFEPPAGLPARRLLEIRVALISPELVLEAVGFPSSPVKGVVNSVSATVRNLGFDPVESARLALYVDEIRVAEGPSLAVPADAAVPVQFEWTPSSGGEVTLRLALEEIIPPEPPSRRGGGEAVATVFVTHHEVTLGSLGPTSRVTAPGERVSFTWEAVNVGNVEEEVEFTVLAVPDGWTVSTSPSQVNLPAGQTEWVAVEIVPPLDLPATPYSVDLVLLASLPAQPDGAMTAGMEVVVADRPVVRELILGSTSPVPAGPLGIELRFSRPMDTTRSPDLQLVATMGGQPSIPAAGSYTDPLRWVGSAAIKSGDDGVYAVAVADGFDANGLRLAHFVSSPIRVDTIAPVTAHDAPSSWVSSPVLVHLSVSDASPTITYWTVDGSAPRPGSPSGPVIRVESEGTTRLRYTSVDAAGNVETMKEAVVRIDRQTPEIVLERVPSAAEGEDGWYRELGILLHVRDGLSGVNADTLRCNLNEDEVECEPGHVIPITMDGRLEFKVTVSDVAGNTAAATELLKHDASPPRCSVTFRQADEGAGQWFFSIAANDSESGVQTISYNISGGDLLPYTDPISLDANVTENVTCVVRDRAGNEGEVSEAFEALVPVVEPEAEVLAPPVGPEEEGRFRTFLRKLPGPSVALGTLVLLLVALLRRR